MMRSPVPDPADKLTALERAVLEAMLADPALPARRRALVVDDVRVTDRDYSGAGFMIDLGPTDVVAIFAPGTSFHWGKVGARLNADRQDVGFVIFVRDGVIAMIEGYSYNGEWPERIDLFELYPLK